MKSKDILLILACLLIATVCIGSVVAADDSNSEDTNLTQDSENLELQNSEEFNEVGFRDSNDEDVLSDGKTIPVDNYGEYHREMSDKTIKNAINNNASAGDTIVINGDYYDHVHIIINKPLTIKSDVGTKLSPCSSTATSGYQGIFYLTSEASGTVIEGFNFIDDDMFSDTEGYGILINGASNITIRNCTFSNNKAADAIRLENAQNTLIENVEVSKTVNGIKIKNSIGTIVRNSTIKESTFGIYDVDSNNSIINYNNILKNNVGVAVSGSSNNPIISFNNITDNTNGVNLTSSDNINILANYIATNTNHGVYVNCKIQKINITGNFFYKNELEEVFNDVNTKGFFVDGGENLEIINNNYFVGLGNRPVDHDDSFGGGVFLGHAFEINTNVACPKIYATHSVSWTDANYRLLLSNITQSKKGVYSISIVDADGNVAEDLCSVPVIFYLNKDNIWVDPQIGDVYRRVIMNNGTATVRFNPEDFKDTGNFVLAVFPGNSQKITGDSRINIQNFTIDDDCIPGNISNTTIELYDLNTAENSNVNYTITLKDANNAPVAYEPVVFDINSKIIQVTTDVNGRATIKINETSGNYTIKVDYAGDDIEWAPTSAQAKITVNKASSDVPSQDNGTGKEDSPSKPSSNGGKKSTKIVASNYAMFIKKASYYKFTLKDANGKLLAKQKVTVKINKKIRTVKTNAKGVAKIKLKLKKGKYKITLSYKGNKSYKSTKTTKKITVKKVLKTKLTAPKVTVEPKKSTNYKITLKDQNGVGIKKQKVILKVNGKKYNKKTNSKGQATINVKFSKLKSYKVKVTYKGTKKYKKSSATGKITVKKTTSTPTDSKDKPVVMISTQLSGYNRTFSKGSNDSYVLTLRDASGKGVSNQAISYSLNNLTYSQNTDENGQVKVNISSLLEGSYKIIASHSKTSQYGASESINTITILNKTGITFIESSLPNDEIQRILDETTNPVEFLDTEYTNISLNINKALDITFQPNTTLSGKTNSPVLTISVSNFNVSNLKINANEGSGIVIQNADGVTLLNNTISNTLDSSKRDNYNSGKLTIPGNGVSLINVNNVKLIDNDIASFGNAIFAQNSDIIEMSNNTLSLSNYGINYGLGVKNTNITNNLITKNIGLYVMDVPEGPLGYGIFLNQSAVNVSIIGNKILDNYMGISVDANYSTGIVILYNWISDNALEGIRFNAGYDLAENAVEPNVNDNAIYRNAKGPSLWLLGELSANPDGIYHYGIDNDTKKLQLGTNWYGKNARITWDYTTNTTGYGTMCPRIATTYISVKEIDVVSPGNYQVKFYNNDDIASKLPEFEMFATLNDNVEVKFYVINGIGNFSFDSGYNIDSNEIKVRIGSLTDPYRDFVVLLNKTLSSSEIPI